MVSDTHRRHCKERRGTLCANGKSEMSGGEEECFAPSAQGQKRAENGVARTVGIHLRDGTGQKREGTNKLLDMERDLNREENVGVLGVE